MEQDKTLGRLNRGIVEWGGPLVIFATAIVLCVRSWLKWPDVLVDYGQQLYVPWRLNQGDVLYRDIEYFHGPLSSYLHAAVMGLWGERMLSLVLFNLLVAGGLIVLIYQLLDRLAGRLAATGGALVFVAVFAFGHYLRLGNYNYVTPYTSEITHGIVLALAAILCMVLELQPAPDELDGHAGRLSSAGLLLGLTFLTKAEVFLALLPAVGLGMLLILSRPGAEKYRLRSLPLFGLSAAVPPLVAWALLSLSMSPAEAYAGITKAYAALFGDGTSELAFYRSRMGLDAPVANLQRMGLAALLPLLILGPAAWASLRWGRTSGRGRILLGGLAATPLFLIATQVGSPLWMQAGRAWPVYMIVLAVLSYRSWTRERSHPASPAVLVTTLFALALLLKIVLNSRVYHYGFVLAMPATLLVVAACLGWIPAWIDRRGGQGGVFKAAAATFLLVAVGAHLSLSGQRLAEKAHLVGQGGDAFWADGRGPAVDAFLSRFAEIAEPGSTLLVVPDGIMLNYLSRTPSPFPYLNYVPTEVFAYGEERILDHWRWAPADYVAVVDKSTAEFGYAYFGRDYGIELMDWIDAEYETLGLVGAPPLTGRGFGIELKVRRNR